MKCFAIFLVQSHKYFGFDLILFGTQVMTWFIAFPERKMFVKEGSSRPFFPMKLTLNIKLSNNHGGPIVLTYLSFKILLHTDLVYRRSH